MFRVLRLGKVAGVWESRQATSPTVDTGNSLQSRRKLSATVGRPAQHWGKLPQDLELYRSPATHKAGWLRFQEYAALVQEIIIDPFVPSAGRPARLLDDTFWCQLASAVGDAPILPHLKAATFRSMSSLIPIDMGLFRLLNPSMQELNFILPVASDGDLIRLKKALSASLSSAESIQLNHLRPLTNLPNLEHLTFTLDGYWNPFNSSITFAGLRSLTVLTFDLGNIVILLTHLDAPKLQSLSITSTHPDAARLSYELPDCLRMLVAKYPSLTALQWTSNQVWDGRRGYLGNRLSSVPFAERRFSIQFYGPVVPYTPADFRACAQAWPDLEAFHLGDSYGANLGDPAWKRGEQYADVESIFAFARHCPQLRSLRLRRVEQFGSGEASLEELTRRAPARHWLRELCVDQVCFSIGIGKAQEKDRNRHRQEFKVRFRGLLMKVFPSATLRIQK
ncbi:hypothetical protein V8D89_005248 [Ganoderma adspersum]